MSHPYRSVLYLPGARARVLEKAKTLPADALIFDLEDAVAPDDKLTARNLVAETVKAGGYGARKILVRINGLDTQWGADDLDAAIAAEPDGILVPKVCSGADLTAISDKLTGKTRLWAMMETPAGILNAAEIAASTPILEGFVIGTNDLVKDLFAQHTADRVAVLTSLSICLLAARANGLICVDGVFNAFKDEAGLQIECQQGRDMGFDGKTLIHPAQLDIANTVFAPSADDLALAERHIEAFAAVDGVAVVDGKIVENLHVETAQRLLAKSALIKKLREQ
ncbi:MAG: CoA ester lyase [Rhodobacteraceae bacterium]|nr:CoA ester lyase [Paracoccaceae bacterium]